MEVRIHTSAGEFREIAEPLYRRDPVVNTIELTLLRSERLGADTLMLTVWDDGVAVGAALQTPPYPLACNGIPVAAHRPVAIELARIRPDLSGVLGRRDRALAFADAWHAETGAGGAITTSEMLYRLGTLHSPTDVSGARREATAADRAVLIDWVEHFFVETFSHRRDDAAGILSLIEVSARCSPARVDDRLEGSHQAPVTIGVRPRWENSAIQHPCHYA